MINILLLKFDITPKKGNIIDKIRKFTVKNKKYLKSISKCKVSFFTPNFLHLPVMQNVPNFTRTHWNSLLEKRLKKFILPFYLLEEINKF